MSNYPKWPVTLPCLRLGVKHKVKTGMIKSTLQTGRTRYRRGFTAETVELTAKWAMTDEQYQTFHSFYKNQLDNGAKWFEIELLEPAKGLVYRLCHFAGDREYQLIGAPNPNQTTGRLWEVSAPLEVYLDVEY